MSLDSEQLPYTALPNLTLGCPTLPSILSPSTLWGLQTIHAAQQLLPNAQFQTHCYTLFHLDSTIVLSLHTMEQLQISLAFRCNAMYI